MASKPAKSTRAPIPARGHLRRAQTHVDPSGVEALRSLDLHGRTPNQVYAAIDHIFKQHRLPNTKASVEVYQNLAAIPKNCPEVEWDLLFHFRCLGFGLEGAEKNAFAAVNVRGHNLLKIYGRLVDFIKANCHRLVELGSEDTVKLLDRRKSCQETDEAKWKALFMGEDVGFSDYRCHRSIAEKNHTPAVKFSVPRGNADLRSVSSDHEGRPSRLGTSRFHLQEKWPPGDLACRGALHREDPDPKEPISPLATGIPEPLCCPIPTFRTVGNSTMSLQNRAELMPWDLLKTDKFGPSLQRCFGHAVPTREELKTDVPGLDSTVYITPMALRCLQEKKREYQIQHPDDPDTANEKAAELFKALGGYLPAQMSREVYYPEDLVPARFVDDQLFDEETESEAVDYWIKLWAHAHALWAEIPCHECTEVTLPGRRTEIEQVRDMPNPYDTAGPIRRLNPRWRELSEMTFAAWSKRHASQARPSHPTPAADDQVAASSHSTTFAPRQTRSMSKDLDLDSTASRSVAAGVRIGSQSKQIDAAKSLASTIASVRATRQIASSGQAEDHRNGQGAGRKRKTASDGANQAATASKRVRRSDK